MYSTLGYLIDNVRVGKYSLCRGEFNDANARCTDALMPGFTHYNKDRYHNSERLGTLALLNSPQIVVTLVTSF